MFLEILQIIMLFLLAIILIVFIIIGIKGILYINEINRDLDDIYNILKSLNWFFSLIDTLSQKVYNIKEIVDNTFYEIINKIFKNII